MSVTSIDPAAPSVSRSAETPRIRVWPAVILLVVYWGAVLFIHNVEMAMLPRFIARCVTWLVTVPLFLGWWMLNWRVGWRDRLGAVGVLVLAIVVATMFSHSTFRPVVFIIGIPAAFTTWTIWLAISRRWRLRTRRIGFAFIVPLTLGFYLLFRGEGIDGAQRTTFQWRWTPSGEELFLASKAESNSVTVPVPQREWTLRPDDWPAFRGPGRDGVVTGVSIADDWLTAPPKLVWKQRVGPGWSSLIVVDGFLFTQEQRGEDEAIVCHDAATGKEVWTHLSATRFNDAVSGPGPRATPTFHAGRIHALGANGLLTCVSADTGVLVWTKSIRTEAGANTPQWGYSTSPLVVDDRVIMFAGGDRGRSLLAFQEATGDVVWARGTGTFSYSSPQLVELHGERLLLMQSNASIAGIRPTDGTMLWERPSENIAEEAMIQPHLLQDDSLLISSGSGIARIDVQFDGQRWTTSDRWKSNSVKPDFSDVAIHDGRIYGLDDGILCCADLETGRRLWKRGRYGHGQILLLADQSRLLVACESGEIVLVAANPEKLEELGRFQAIEGKSWNHPVIAEGRLFIRNGEEMACFELPTNTASDL